MLPLVLSAESSGSGPLVVFFFIILFLLFFLQLHELSLDIVSRYYLPQGAVAVLDQEHLLFRHFGKGQVQALVKGGYQVCERRQPAPRREFAASRCEEGRHLCLESFEL